MRSRQRVRCPRLLKVVLVVAALSSGVAAQPDPLYPDLPIADLRARLEALEPSSPEAYFRLGEEVASEAQSPSEARLAKRLYVLAFELDRRRAGRLGPSIALALADLVRLDRDRRWLRALARSLDQRYAAPDWHSVDSERMPDAVGLRAAETLGLARAGYGREAAERLDDPEVAEIIERFDALLSPLGVPGGMQLVRKHTREWPCPVCNNERITRVGELEPREHAPCPNCHGNPGPDLSHDELIAHLRFESRLLNGIQRSWSAQIAVDGGAPVRDPRPEELAETLGIDPARVAYRDGAWRTPERSDKENRAEQP